MNIFQRQELLIIITSNNQVIMSSTGIAVGLNRGYPVTKRAVGARPSHAKAVS